MLRVLGITATGGLALLIAGLILSSQLKLGLEMFFASLIAVFVIAGAVALVLRSA